MSTDRFTAAMGYIDDDLISDAVTYMPKKKSPVRWMKWVAVAACFCLVIGLSLPELFKTSSSDGLEGNHTIHDEKTAEHEIIQDIEPYTQLSVAEAVVYEPYGKLFPQTILDGYVLEDNKVGLYNGKVMKAVYCNNNAEDVLTITISDKGYFENVELNIVLKNGQNGSEIYMDSGDYVVRYSFSTRDINAIENFDEMANSALAFKP